MLQQARKITRPNIFDRLDLRLYLVERRIAYQKGRDIVAFLSTSTKGLELLVGPVAFDAKGGEIIRVCLENSFTCFGLQDQIIQIFAFSIGNGSFFGRE